LCDVCGWKTVIPDEGCLNCKRLAREQALDRMVAEQERLGLYEKCIQISDNVKEDAVCKTHPDAPHGFDRNASLSEDRYVCECEGWEPPPKPEPFAWCHEKAGGYRSYFWNQQYPDDIPLYITPPKREWVGLSAAETENITSGSVTLLKVALETEAKLKEKNYG
jgi:hypothetical protein